jgi:membrane fusion protein (multidrug efflux system)
MNITTMIKPFIHKAIILFLLGLCPGISLSAEKAAHNVTVIELQEQALQRSYVFIGIVEPARHQKILNQEPGRILELPYYEGDRIEQGALLVRIDGQELRAELDKAMANRKQATTDLDRLKKLQPRNLASEDELARAQTQLEVARAEETLLRTRLGETQIKAGFNAIISERLMEQGDQAPAYTHILTLYDPESLIIKTRLPERLMPGLRTGQFRIRWTDFRNDSVIEATLKRVYPGLDNETHQVIIELAPSSTSVDLVPGMLTQVEFTPGAIAKLWLPLNALHEDAQGRYVYRARDGKAIRSRVKTGMIRADHIQVIDGIEPGDQIITAGFIGLRDGKAITTEKKNQHD